MDRYLEILHRYWGYPDFRGIQREIIESIGSGKDTLGLMPTGGGKSLTFQVPALAQKGVCVVITPLISLMKDQVDHLKQRNIPAAAIYSGMRQDEIVTILENSIFGGIKILYVAPERLGSELFLAKLSHMRVSFITVDEAHCISQWGHDFRPAYLQIAKLRTLCHDAPILALTATATKEVIEDIRKQLQFKDDNVFRMSFERKNLAYVVRYTEDKMSELVHILKCTSGSAIVYVRYRKRTKEIAKLLNDNKIPATWYHAGINPEEKSKRQEDWQNDKVRVMVATNAFGMGIDKPDVRTVIHPDPPSSIEEYFQEAGRAGRDGGKSYAVLLWNTGDKRTLHKRISDTYPPIDFIQDVYEHLAYFYEVGVNSGRGAKFEFNIAAFSRTYGFPSLRVNSALVILSQAGYITYDQMPDTKSRLMINVTPNDLYKINFPHNEDITLTALIREYGGVFRNGYVFIDEELISRMSGLNRDETYSALISLSRKRIVSYIPRSNVPTIRYETDRVDGKDVKISEDVYELRKKELAKHIESVIDYMENDDVCRSRQLLRYFGDKESDDCGQCDVCISHKNSKAKEDIFINAQKEIISFLSDGKKHWIKELYNLNVPNPALSEALDYLVKEEKVEIENIFIRIAE